MKGIVLAAIGAFMVLGAAGAASAAPVSGADVKPAITRDSSAAQQTHWRGWRHCHRRCVWRHGYRHCWRVCHGGGWGHHHRRHRGW